MPASRAVADTSISTPSRRLGGRECQGWWLRGSPAALALTERHAHHTATRPRAEKMASDVPICYSWPRSLIAWACGAGQVRLSAWPPTTVEGSFAMYEVHPDNKGHWILYDVTGGDHAVVAWFVEKEHAEFAKQAFQERAG